jgi:hypothetical protein
MGTRTTGDRITANGVVDGLDALDLCLLYVVEPSGPRSLAMRVKRWAMNTNQPFMIEQGRQGCVLRQVCLVDPY